ncbi:MAG: type III pantothenate kinase [Erysipelotrichaceae bacterium]
MLIAIDIGNTNITIGFFEGEALIGTYRMTTKMQRTSDEYGIVLLNFLMSKSKTIEDIDDIIVSSVVPKIMHSFNNSLRKYLRKEPILIGPGIKTGIEVKTEHPKSVGADRIVDLAGAYYTYNQACLVIDFGTATTFDFVDEKGVFAYGVTVPGIEISAQALWSNAAKLPEIEIVKPKSILARNTVQSMQAGLVYGYIGQTEYIIQQFKKALKREFLVVATGGLGRIISDETKLIDVYDPNLTFVGLKTIYERNQKEAKTR